MATLLEQLQAEMSRVLGDKGLKVLRRVEIYGGEFTSKEIGNHSTSAPVCLIACLGWERFTKAQSREHRISGPYKTVKLAFFVMTKASTRVQRMQQAISICEHIDHFLAAWGKSSADECGCLGDFYGVTAENLYGRDTDSSGLGLWMVRANVDMGYCDVGPLAAYGGDVDKYLQTLVAPTFQISSNGLTEVDAEPETVEPILIEQNMNLNSNDIGADDE